MNRETPTPRGFAFRLTEEALRFGRSMSAEEKLRWLEEANRFILQAVPPERLARWERYRRSGKPQSTPS